MSDREREGSGEFLPDVGDEELIAAVEKHDPAATSEVAAEVNLSRQAADYRLRQLAERGEVNKKKIAASLVWSPVRGGE